MDFLAIDVETANPDMSSICQIGIACYENGVLLDSWKTLIDPEDYFCDINVSIHGITEKSINGAPTLAQVSDRLCQYLSKSVNVCHTHFDRVAISQAFNKYEMPCPQWTWLDTACVARRTWHEFARSGYGLGDICEFLGYKFEAHDALEDAKAAAFILISAIQKSGLDLQSWLLRVKQPIDPNLNATGVARSGNPDGKLFGEVLVFTGALAIPRRDAAEMAARVGCEVASGVTKHTTLLVVGDQDVAKLAGHEKSSKHRKAEELILKGQRIRILRESDFAELVRMAEFADAA